MSERESWDLRVKFTLLMVSLLAVGAPFLLLVMKPLIGWYEPVEELVKLGLGWYLTKELRGQVRASYGAWLGGLFGMSEMVLYVMNSAMAGVYEGLWLRLVTTVPMHTVTTMVILTMGRKWGWGGWGAGYVVALSLHVVFNRLVVGI